MRAQETFLTKNQIRVIKLRNKGLSQAEIARRLGTSRANVCSIEKRAKRNIKKAERTLNLAKKICAPVTLQIKPEEDVFDVAKQLFSKADEEKIDVKLDTPALIARIREKAGHKLRGRVTIEKIELIVTSSGDVIVS